MRQMRQIDRCDRQRSGQRWVDLEGVDNVLVVVGDDHDEDEDYDDDDYDDVDDDDDADADPATRSSCLLS